MNNAMAAVNDTATFTPFLRLPRELRDEIWKQVANQPRIIQLTTYRTGYDKVSEGFLSRLQQNTLGPALLYTNSEARAAGLKVYKKWYTGNVPGHNQLPGFATYVNPACDTVFITTPACYRRYLRSFRTPGPGEPSMIPQERGRILPPGVALASTLTFPWAEDEAVFSMCSELDENNGKNTYILIQKQNKDVPLARNREMLCIKMVEKLRQEGKLDVGCAVRPVTAVGAERRAIIRGAARSKGDDFVGCWDDCWFRFRFRRFLGTEGIRN